jgi:hypothetical protein
MPWGFIKRKVRSSRTSANEYGTPGIHYLATQRGFFQRYDQSGEPVFGSNPRFAKQFDSFEEADAEGHRLMKPTQWIKYYAIFKNA